MMTIFDLPDAHPDVQLPLLRSPVPISIIMVSYLLFVLKLGPQFMAKREPYKLRGLMKIYNLVQIAYNIVLVMIAIYLTTNAQSYKLFCLAPLPSDHKYMFAERALAYLYYLNKILDLVDTVFFVLRKSYKQVTQLHLIHHVFMPSLGYVMTRFYGYGGHLLVTGILNVIVHIIMYTYYYLSSQSESIKRSLWWKQYVTVIQLIQFVLITLHSLLTLTQPNCKTSRPVIYAVLCASLLMKPCLPTSTFMLTYWPRKRKSMSENNQKQ
ncbi:elongation of very long chain fatty acids protein F-like [Drosophila grimshawi]|uniref:elongation of very long chain fatty acids protein F-like n=1 Tax=Drosophila grimshawi TaxID=7222 RepID=UPI0013EEF82D|nr:elongation of very long chain fatty acids protein F-like [Drosophila grimshawi]